MATYPDQEFVEYVIKALVNKPEKIKASRKVDEMGVLITVSGIDPEDMGHVIGRRGQTAVALRLLLKTVGAKNNARVNLKIEEPEGSTHARKAPAADGKDENADAIDLEI